jgi:hypothetical protein
MMVMFRSDLGWLFKARLMVPLELVLQVVPKAPFKTNSNVLHGVKVMVSFVLGSGSYMNLELPSSSAWRCFLNPHGAANQSSDTEKHLRMEGVLVSPAWRCRGLEPGYLSNESNGFDSCPEGLELL